MDNLLSRMAETLPIDGIEYRGGRWPQGFWFILLASFSAHSVTVAFIVKWL